MSTGCLSVCCGLKTLWQGDKICCFYVFYLWWGPLLIFVMIWYHAGNFRKQVPGFLFPFLIKLDNPAKLCVWQRWVVSGVLMSHKFKLYVLLSYYFQNGSGIFSLRLVWQDVIYISNLTVQWHPADILVTRTQTQAHVQLHRFTWTLNYKKFPCKFPDKRRSGVECQGKDWRDLNIYMTLQSSPQLRCQDTMGN